ncbi:MAG: glycosyltransferase N-terminal domain-containing protein [Sediminibacterium sp.]|nr:glycosyltransferase N-terminal domain-containing protein [Sediminibacterium sp.]
MDIRPILDVTAVPLQAMKLFYRLFIALYPIGARVIAPFNPKAKEWIRGRQDVFVGLSKFAAASKAPVIWMHCSSLGEFEQGLPVATALKKEYPSHRLLVSFFSPSGYLVRKNHPIADYVTYLPMDSHSNARQFLLLVKPQLAIFIKYEFWHFYLSMLKERQIPTLLVSGIFRPDQLFFRSYGGFYRNMLSYFTQFFVQDEHSKKLLDSVGYGNRTTVSGDTRFDRVIDIAHQFREYPAITHFCAAHTTIVAGSTWSEDDKALHHLAIQHKELRMVVAPHDIQPDRLEECIRYYPDAMLYSEYLAAFEQGNPPEQVRSLIINNMGMLSSLYHYAHIAFIGGGFTDDGIHNTLEAAVYGVPVVFGPVYEKYLEAIDLIDAGAAFTALDVVELEEIINDLLVHKEKRSIAGTAARNYVRNHAGATAKVLKYIQENLRLIR